jgi:hypothetical protein
MRFLTATMLVAAGILTIPMTATAESAATNELTARILLAAADDTTAGTDKEEGKKNGDKKDEEKKDGKKKKGGQGAEPECDE